MDRICWPVERQIARLRGDKIAMIFQDR